MKPLEELIDNSETGWNLVKNWINEGKNNIEIIPSTFANANEALYKTQVTTRSPMGAIIYHTGGILVDHGWIRILGSGSERLNRNLPDWNEGKSYYQTGEKPSFLLIADDVIGGFFMLNGGALGNDLGKVYYFAPDSLEFEPLEINYSEFLLFCFNNNLNEFYQNLRWENWQEDATRISNDKVFSFYPFLWTEEGKHINKIHREEIPIEEQYFFNLKSRKQLGLD
ncbi:MAG: DUF2625 domain-containing protein [Pyrinomonadaceae bacterium]|nr:DUF2625 domain-containing protein [Pyrinomonadaceae bacterium]